MNQVVIFLLLISVTFGLSLDCLSEINNLVSDQGNRFKLLKVLDSFGKPVGILRGSFTSLGDFDECISIADMNYFLVGGVIQLPYNKTFDCNIGTCFPSVCSEDDVQEFLLILLEQVSNPEDLSLNLNFPLLSHHILIHNEYLTGLNVSISSVDRFQRPNWTFNRILLLTFIVFLLLLCIVFTCLEYFFKQYDTSDDCACCSNSDTQSSIEVCEAPEEKEFHASCSNDTLLIGSHQNRNRNFFFGLLHCVSFYGTLERLFKSSKLSFVTELNLLDVFKVFSLWWIILLSLFHAIISIAPVDKENFTDLSRDSSVMVLLNGVLAFDSLLFASAFQICYLVIRRQKPTFSFNYISYASLRYLKIVPLYALVLFVWYLLYPMMGSGPLWFRSIRQVSDSCSKYWWTNLVFINNFYPYSIEDSCMPGSWYLAVNFQIFLGLPLIILFFFRNCCFGPFSVFLLLGGIFGSLAIVFYTTYTENIPFLLLNFNGEYSTKFLQIYFQKPQSHVSVSLIAVAFALLCIKLKRKGLKLGFWWTCSLQIIGIFLLLLTLYIPYEMRNSGSFWTSFYHVLSRLLWPIGLGMLSLPSVLNPRFTPMIQSFSSWPAWHIMSKLTFGVYLFHSIVINVFFGNLLREYPFRVTSLILSYGGILLWSYLSAAVGYVVVEAPLRNICEYILSKS